MAHVSVCGNTMEERPKAGSCREKSKSRERKRVFSPMNG